MNELSTRFKQAYDHLLLNGYISGNKDFAAKIGVSTSMITEIFKGRSNVGTTALQNIVSMFNIDANWLLTGIGAMTVTCQTIQIADQSAEAAVYYKMYKEKEAKADAQAEEIGVLKHTVQTLEEKIEGLQQADTLFPEDSVGSTPIRKKGVAGSGSVQFAGKE